MAAEAKVTIKWDGDKVFKDVEENTALGIKMVCLDLKQESSEQAPVLTGDLRGNCSAAFEKEIIAPPAPPKDDPAAAIPVEVPAKALTGRVGYTLPYALRQHEELGYAHPMGGKAKYLEDPFNQNIQNYGLFIAKKAGKGL